MDSDNDLFVEVTDHTATLINRFVDHPSVSREQAKNLWKILRDSDDLAEKLDDLVCDGLVTAVNPLATPDAAAKYFPGSGSLELNLRDLDRGCNQYSVTFTLGHELQHARDRNLLVDNHLNFSATVEQESKLSHPNYTHAMEEIIQKTRESEARAHIGGWNTLANTLREKHVDAGSPLNLMAMHRHCPERMGDFMQVDGRRMHSPEGYKLKENLSLNSDMSMPMSAANTSAMATYYADKELKPPFGFGDRRSGDYRHSVATSQLNLIIKKFDYGRMNDRDMAPEIRLDMDRLGLSRQMMHEVGVDLHRGVKPLKIVDKSSQTEPIKLLHHTTTSTDQEFTAATSSAQTGPSRVDRQGSSHAAMNASIEGAIDQRVTQNIPRRATSRSTRARK